MHSAPTPTARSEQRRQQVLDAAAECFRRYGFHGASIAQISKHSGMSPGHIYHFFENKEAIIAAIVEQHVAHVLDLIAHFEGEDDLFGALIRDVDIPLHEKTDPAFFGLWLEILAEASRNANVADIVRGADTLLRAHVMRLQQKARDGRDIRSALDPAAVNEVIMAMFEGLSNRYVQNPDMDKAEVEKALRVAAQAMLEV